MKLVQQIRIQFRMFLTQLQVFLIRQIAGRDRAILIGWKIDSNGVTTFKDPEFKKALVAHCDFEPEKDISL